MLALRARARGPADLRVLATVWWYSASPVLVTPALAGLVAGVPLSARLADTSLAFLPGGLPVAAVSVGAAGPIRRAELRESLGAVVAAVAEAGRMRERPLWAIATDSIANQLLALGRARGRRGRARPRSPRPLAAGDRVRRCRCRATWTSPAPGSPAGRRAA